MDAGPCRSRIDNIIFESEKSSESLLYTHEVFIYSVND